MHTQIVTTLKLHKNICIQKSCSQNVGENDTCNVLNLPTYELFQLSLPPSEMASDVLSDLPESADRYEFNVQDGDVIIMATDGIFDNVPDAILVAEIR